MSPWANAEQYGEGDGNSARLLLHVLGHNAVEQDFVGRLKDHVSTAASGEEFEGLHMLCVSRSPVSEAFHYAWQLFGRDR